MQKRIGIVLVLFLTVSSLWCIQASADEDDASVWFARMDSAFTQRSLAAVGSVLSDCSNSDSLSFSLLEAYTVNKIRVLVIAEDYQFARDVSLTVVKYDIDNYDAIELYVMLDKLLKAKPKVAGES